MDKLQSRVDERAEPEGDGPQPHHQSPVTLVVLRGHHLDHHPRVEFLIFYIDIFGKPVPGFLAFLPSTHKIQRILATKNPQGSYSFHTFRISIAALLDKCTLGGNCLLKGKDFQLSLDSQNILVATLYKE